ncbi:hypothetical protein OZ401_003469 [Candidatus Chlorohelix allophototropha]|uniref:IPT/TIG domain-containing protein n=2 Tax=Candidatus Chlorohelix allophototropha TaxID=3003348 RepID=A0ABY9B9F4_9CHLR|nr:hypothetical protein OZ401_003469 [Chloroflexota bacterium L227-S17]
MKCRRSHFALKHLGLALFMMLSLSLSAFVMPQQAANASTLEYDFGGVKVGSYVQVTFPFSTPSGGTITETKVTFESIDNAFSIVSDTCTNFNNSGTCQVTIRFAPPTPGYFLSPIGFSYYDNEEYHSRTYYLVGTGLTGALPICAVSVSPDRSLKVDSETDIAVSFKVKNQGVSSSYQQVLEMPFDATLVPSHTSFSDPSMWVSPSEGGKVKIELPDLAPNETLSGTVFFHLNPDNMPVVGKELSFNYSVLYSTDQLNPYRPKNNYNPGILNGFQKRVAVTTVTGICTSNTVKVSFTDGNRDETVGKVMPMTPGAAEAVAGTKVTVTGDMFIAGELLSTWITTPNGQSTALAGGRADAAGAFSLTVDTTGLVAGSYVIAIYGHDSEITGRTILTVK